MHERVIAQIVINDVKRVSQGGDGVYLNQYCSSNLKMIFSEISEISKAIIQVILLAISALITKQLMVHSVLTILTISSI